MKNLVLISLTLIFCVSGFSQSSVRLSLGYYGETIFHPGIILNGEIDKPINHSFSVPLRVGVGYYFHRYNHQALFSDFVLGLRWHFGSRFYTGISGGVGVMASWHHSDLGVFQVDSNGNIEEASSFAGIDFMPSVNAEFAYKLEEGTGHKIIWLRPIVFFQSKVNDTVLLHFAVALGYTF